MIPPGVTQLRVPIVDDAERFRRPHAVCRGDLAVLAGLDGSASGRQALELGVGSRARRIVPALATLNP